MRSLLIVFVVSAGIRMAYAQSKQISFEYLTADDGLSGNYVSCVFRDSKDYLWIGTNEQGVNKFNGYTFTLYEHDNEDSLSLSSNNVFCVYEDKMGNIWVGTANGLNRYDPKSETFEVFRTLSDDPQSIGGNHVYELFEDKQGALWVVCGQGGGLNKWIPESRKFKRYLVPEAIDGRETHFNRNSLTSVQVDTQGVFWVGNSGPEIYSFEPETESYRQFRNTDWELNDGSFKTICLDKDGTIWVASHLDGFYSFNTQTHQFEGYGKDIGLSGSPDKIITDVILEDDYNILIGANQGGVSRFNRITKKFQDITCENCNAFGLNSLGVRSLYIDKEQILWVGTTRGGVNYYNPKRHKFNHAQHGVSTSFDKLKNIIGWIYEDSNGLIWLATDGGGISIYDPDKGFVDSYAHDRSDPSSLSGNVVRCIEEDKKGNYWIGTWDAGLNKLNPNTGKFERFGADDGSSGLSSNTVWNFKITQENKLWLTQYIGGIEVIGEQGKVVQRHYFRPNDSTSLSGWLIRMIYEDNDQNIWVCTQNGINLYDKATEHFTVYNNFPQNDIKVVFMDREGLMWAGSVNSGLFRFDHEGNVLNVYNKSNGLSDNSIVSILEDNNDRLWVATKGGLNCLNPKTGVINKFFKEDGLQGDEFFDLSALKSKNGVLYFGGYDGFNYFHPDSIQLNEFVPKVYITDFKIANKSVVPGAENSVLAHHISETQEIVIPAGVSFFSFEFAAISYTNPEMNNYAYLMEGFDQEWNYIGTKRDAAYTNLEPGEYIFRVKASNNDGVWNESGTSIRIKVMPAFWQTWFFKISAGLIAISFVFLIYYTRLARIRNQKAMLVELVAERTNELEHRQKQVGRQAEKLLQQNEQLEEQKRELGKVINELKDTQAQLLHSEKMASLGVLTAGVAHEINNPLNFIQTGLYAADVVMKDENINSDTLQEILGRMHEGVHRTASIVKSLNTFSRKSGDVVRPCNIHKIIDTSLLILDHELKYNCEVHKSFTKEEFELIGSEENLHQVFINILLNALHSFDKQGIISIITNVTDDRLEILIEDNGKGIPEDKINQIFDPFFTTKDPGKGVGLGLSIVYKIISEHKGTIKYESKENIGTKVILTLPVTTFG